MYGRRETMDNNEILRLLFEYIFGLLPPLNFKPVEEEINNESIQDKLEIIEMFANRGWVIPSNLLPALASTKIDNKTIDYIINNFAADNHKYWNGLKSFLINHNDLKCFKHYILNAYRAFEQKNFMGAGVLLFATLDGILRKTSNFANPQAAEYFRTRTNFSKRTEIIEVASMSLSASEIDNYFTWYSCWKVIERFTRTIDWNQEPNVLNRHSVLHGALEREITEIECVQLIFLIFNMTFVYSKWKNMRDISEAIDRMCGEGTSNKIVHNPEQLLDLFLKNEDNS